jgi:hypothetical protein
VTEQRPGWAGLGSRARAWRVAHGIWSLAQLGGLAHVWRCAIVGRRDGRLWAAIAFLVLEGGALALGRGNCPMGRLQTAWGDPVPFFELVLPPRAAKAAVPALAAVSLAGIAAVVLRRPGLVAHAVNADPGRGLA